MGVFRVPYNDTEKEQYERISDRLRKMNGLRNKALPLLGGLTITQKFQRDLNMHTRQKGSNIPRSQQWHAQIKGTQTMKTYHKMISLMVADNLGPLVKAYDKEYIENAAFSDALTEVVRQTNRIEDINRTGDAHEALAALGLNGVVFVEEYYDVITGTDKEYDFDPSDLSKMRSSLKESKRISKSVGKRVLNPEDVFLGSLRVGNIQDQPDIAVRTFLDWSKAKSKYGNWERWKYVEDMQGKTMEELQENMGQYSDSYNMMQVGEYNKDRVEIIRYMNKDNEFQIIINGVLMLPAGMGFPWGYPTYNIASQRLYLYKNSFPYGMGMYDLLGPDQEIHDKTMGYIIDHVRQVVDPSVALLNKSIRANNLFQPSTVHRGLAADEVSVLTPSNRMGAEVWNTVQHFGNEIDSMFSPTTMGAPLSGEHSATEVVEMQKQSMKIVGFIKLAYSLLIRDMTWLRIHNVLSNCVQPDGLKTVHDPIRDLIVPNFQEFTMDNVLLRNSKRGKMKVRFIPKDYQEKVLRAEVQMSENDLQSAKKLGFSRVDALLRRKALAYNDLYSEIILDPKLIKDLQWFFKIEVESMKRETSMLDRAEFRESTKEAMNLFGPEALNMERLKDKFNEVHEWDDKFFKDKEEPNPMTMAQQAPGMPVAKGGDGRVMQQQSKGKPSLSNQSRATIKGMTK